MVVGDFAIELDTVVVGSGPGGYVAAIRASQKGQKVAIIERENIGGVCLNVGCIPSKALIAAGHHYQDAKNSEAFGIKTENATLDFTKTQEWKEKQVVNKLTSGVKGLLKKNKVDVIEGDAFFVDENSLRVIHPDSAQTYTFNHAIVATGSRPIEIPGFKFGGRVIDSTGGLALEEVPEKLVIIGGGVIGAELGSAYANLGADVTILEGTPQILPTYEKDLVQLVENDFKKRDVNIITSAMAKEAVDNGDSVTVNYEADGKQESITADYVMVTVGRRPNTDEMGLEQAGVEIGDHGLLQVDNQGQTNVKSIFAIGDVVPGAALAHKASYEAKIAAEAISGEKVAVDYKAMPSVAFTDPEIVTVGMTINEAREAGLDAKAYKFPFAGNGRALSLNKTEGFMRLVTTVEDDVVVGAQIGGVGASDMVSELALAIESGMNAEDIALTIHPHPSLGEITMDASELALGLPIHA
ncbi:dihydrolipoyl dehydrogenase [Tetragenococcus muriaticus]|uniref:Dihydrolipoyl dehydrogenase n=1 Tax=Tetragenococcus muriaticus 3MR10-3 TaxID=1302648 RepID=A0A091BYP4_9ENTE|nr:dihydrolipoyl dehydrogenase [Tetragenococcus muriaticus]KFN90746.1 dihydrolipoamide dehydrogenase of pyruvate dehydrogenase complex [Tetragenococcus muriaticus 3MR10-3]